MNFVLEPEITKNYLLSKFPAETYMEYYLGIPVKKGLFKSPLRNDDNPTCSFYKNSSGDLIFKDFRGDFYGNFINVVMYKYGCSYYSALRIIANDFGFIKNPNLSKHSGKININVENIEEKTSAKIGVEIKNFTSREIDWWLKFGITDKILKKFNVFSCKTIFLNENYFAESNESNPAFGYYGGKMNGLELWRVYFPKRKNFRFISNYPSKKIQGFKQLPKNGSLLIITKSLKDVMCLHSFGISAIAPCSENLFISDSVLEDLKSRFKYIVVFYDNDYAGIFNMNKIKKLHPELIYYYLPRHLGAKDISDYTKEYGISKTKDFIKEQIINFKQK